MRETTKILTLPADGEEKTFRLTKLDAFSGVRVLKLLSASDSDSLQALLFSLPDETAASLMKTCLARAEISLPAGYIRVYDQGCWGLPELEFDTMLCFRLTQEVLAWTLRDFFPGGESPA